VILKQKQHSQAFSATGITAEASLPVPAAPFVLSLSITTP